MEGVLDVWIARDPAAVERWMKGLPAGRARDGILVEYALVAARHPGARFEELAGQVDALPISWGRRLATSCVAEEWGRLDPAAAAAWVQKYSPQKHAAERITSATFTLEESLESPGVFSQDNPENNDRSLHPFAARSETGLEGVEWMSEARYVALGAIAKSWAATDLEAARRWSEALPDSEERRHAMLAVGERWVASDPAGALEYARGQPGAVWRDDWLELVASERIMTDLPAARRVMDLLSPANRDEVQSRVLAKLAETQPETVAADVLRAMLALDWEQARNMYSSTLWSLTRRWTEKDPRGAVAWAASIEREEERTCVLGVLGCQWAGADPRAALAWAADLPASARGPVLTTVACSVASADRELALRIAGMDAGAERIQILCSVGTEWARQEPQAALAWAQAQSPIQDRERCLMAVLKGWAERDPAGARAQLGWFAEETSKPYALRMIENVQLRNERAALRDRLLGKEGK
jgi:hypothetical protein